MILSDKKLYGLVLTGGKSTRMGRTKAEIIYHSNTPQAEYLYGLLDTLCDKTFMSISENQKENYTSKFNCITDLNEFRGPFNGILSAHQQYTDVAWLVLACDLPLMDKNALKELINERDTAKSATAFALKENPLPEPLIAIWEADSLKNVSAFLRKGNSTCPRKFLINTPDFTGKTTKLIFPSNEKCLVNANSPEDYEQAIRLLKS